MGKIANKRNMLISMVVVIFIISLVFVKRQTVKNRKIMPKIGPIVELVYALGTVKAETTFNLRLGMAATITKIYVTEGQLIKNGAPLIDTDSNNTLYSPINGVVSKLYFEKYENAVPGTTVLTIMDHSTYYILLSLDQQSAIRVKKKQKVELSFEGYRQQKFKGVIDKLYSSNGQFLAKIKADKLPDGILPDMTADVAIEIGRKDKTLMVAVSAVKNGTVKIIRQKKILTVTVTTGLVTDEWIEILGETILPTDEILLN